MRVRALIPTGILLSALVGCTAPGPADPSTAPPDSGTAGPVEETTVADCLVGRWSLDAADLADQLRQQLTETGLPVSAAQAAGAVTLDVAPGEMVYTSAVTFAVTAAPGGGPEMVMTQAQDGVSRGAWTVDDSTLSFSSWENGLDVTTTATIGGTLVDVPIELPAEAFGSGDAEVSCDGDAMETTVSGGLFTNRWARVG
jgi:hypothetical protein